jgi:SAM-dependent methyltransferase
MKRSLLDWLCCPQCGSGLALVQAHEQYGEIEAGSLDCRNCRVVYPIMRSIPRFVPSDNYAENFGFQWNRFRQTQLDSHSGTTISRTRFLRTSGWRPEQLAGRTVLDVGCGAGRFTEVALALGAEVFALDYSEAVDACRQNLRAHPKLHVLQADIYALPFAPGSFDYVYCFGVLQHTPDPRSAFAALPPLLKPGGELAVDVYLKYWGNLFYPKYWLRPLTKRVPQAKLFHLVERSAPVLLRLSRALGKLPHPGSLLRRLVPVANYEGVYPLSEQQLREWAVLDTFDMLAPAYDQPQTSQAVHSWLNQAGLEEIHVAKVNHLVGRARRPRIKQENLRCA